MSILIDAAPMGLSPRVRGNLRGANPGAIPRRSIPACAGEPEIVGGAAEFGKVYPRVCGGTAYPAPTELRIDGLSPRVRGNRRRPPVRRRQPGSIPACAGEPLRRAWAADRARVYPRVCGGTMPTNSPVASAPGLSPRVRGNPIPQWAPTNAARSIPACAGEPPRRSVRRWIRRVYPRVCGGTRLTGGHGGISQGLSPRVRGNQVRGVAVSGGRGSIPACAGEPSKGQMRSAKDWVYPRVCGGTSAAPHPGPRPRGLSPRVRGNRADYQPVATIGGSIPACAGEPGPGRRSYRHSQVYPRVCGGTKKSPG